MKTKDFIYIGIIIFLLFLGGCGAKYGIKYYSDKEVSFRDKLGRLNTTVQTLEVTNKQLKKAADSLEIEITDLISLTNITTTTVIQGKGKTITKIDTFYTDSSKTIIQQIVKTDSLNINNKWEKGYITFDGDTIEYKINSLTDLILGAYQANPRSNVFVTGINKNPNAINVGISQIRLRPKDQILEIEPSVALVYDLISNKPAIGPGISLGLDINEIKERRKSRKLSKRILK